MGQRESLYGEPRLTHDVDLVVDLPQQPVDSFVALFPSDELYVPPREVIAVESRRRQRGHFNIIHHTTGFKADIYSAGQEEIHAWALAKVRVIRLEGVSMRIAPPEYVILRKLEYFREGGSEKHLRDIRAILQHSGSTVDAVELRRRIKLLALEKQWALVGEEAGGSTAS